MPVDLSAVTTTQFGFEEHPDLEKYMLSFRVNQCLLYVEQRCDKGNQCFDYHAPNQRRRPSFLNKDRKFSYSADKLCPLYDPKTGSCTNGDDCKLLHNTAGNTEMLYHIKYFKTAVCPHATDFGGVCTKNGRHCPYAHGPRDSRDSVLEIDAQDYKNFELSKWKKPMFVFAYYKSYKCRETACSQDVNCPGAHGELEKRRNPLIYTYSATQCPDLQAGFPQCDAGSKCSFAHTALERLYHIDKYKSEKCKFKAKRNFCPRGHLCQFAHEDSEIEFMKQVRKRLEKRPQLMDFYRQAD